MKKHSLLISITIATLLLVIILIRIWLPFLNAIKPDNQSSDTADLIGLKPLGELISIIFNLVATVSALFIWASVYICIRYMIFRDREIETKHYIIYFNYSIFHNNSFYLGITILWLGRS